MKDIKTINNENDKWYTPDAVAKDIICHFNLSGKVLDPFRGKGAFYNNLPENVEKDWCEIDEDKNFFDYTDRVDWIISNPPYSIFEYVMKHSYTLADNIVYLIPLNKLTSSFTRVNELSKFGGIPYIYILPPKVCNFPFGFALGAIWFKKDYKGDTKIEMYKEKK